MMYTYQGIGVGGGGVKLFIFPIETQRTYIGEGRGFTAKKKGQATKQTVSHYYLEIF